MAVNGSAVHGTAPLAPDVGRPTEEPWVRWTRTGQVAHAVVEAEGAAVVHVAAAALDVDRARLTDGSPVAARVVADHVELDLPTRALPRPAVVDIPLRASIRRTAGSRP
jgi:alpha-L-fucosidase